MKKVLGWSGMMLLSILFLSTCKKSDPFAQGSRVGHLKLSIGEAKQHFQGEILSRIKTPRSKTMSLHGIPDASSLFPEKEAVWDGALEKAISTGGNAVMVPLEQKGVYIQTSSNGVMPFGHLNYLFMYRDTVGTIHTEWVSLFPDSSWVNGDRIDYKGLLLVRDFDGGLKKGFKFGQSGVKDLSTKVRLEKVASTSKSISASNDGEEPCFVTIKYRLFTTKCPCENHTFNQMDQCSCHTKPSINLQIVADIDCPWEPEDPPENPPGTGDPGEEPGGGDNGGGGTPDPNDYPPLNCNPDPDYEMPTTPPPGGGEWVPPCSDLPVEGPTGPEGGLLTPVELLVQYLSITDVTGATFLFDNPDVAGGLVDYLYDNANVESTYRFLDWAVDYLMDNPDVTWEQFEHAYINGNNFAADFSDLENPVNAAPKAEIAYLGVELSDVSTPSPQQPKPVIGRTTDRGNTEDMEYGTMGDVSGIIPFMTSYSDVALFNSMEMLFSLTTIRDAALHGVGEQMIARFRNKTGGQFESQTLNQKVKQSTEFRDFLRSFGVGLRDKLVLNGGDIQAVTSSPVDLGLTRPIFNGLYNKFNGLQILVNDTEYTEILLESIADSPNGQNWDVVIEVVLKDHFGLDKSDALTYQYSHGGFPAWWLLQHTRGYRPFETLVKVRYKLSISK